jgi:hypothetical protein
MRQGWGGYLPAGWRSGSEQVGPENLIGAARAWPFADVAATGEPVA